MRRATKRLLKVYAIAVFIFLYAPMVMLVVFSFNSSRVFGQLVGFTTQWYSELAGRADIWTAFNNSMYIGVVTALASMILGTLAAYAMTRFRLRAAWATDAFLYIPIIIPEITEAASILVFFRSANFSLGLTAVIIGHTAFAVSFVYLVVRARLADYDRSVDEAAEILGATPFQRFFRITLPIALPGIIAGTLLAFTVSFDDYVKTRFTIGAAGESLPMLIFSEAARGGVTPEINALAAIMLFISLGLALSRVTFTKAGSLRRLVRFFTRRS